MHPTPGVGVTRSRFYPDKAIQSIHPRYAVVTENMIFRRGGKAVAQIPSKKLHVLYLYIYYYSPSLPISHFFVLLLSSKFRGRWLSGSMTEAFFFFSLTVFKDKNTPSPFLDASPEVDSSALADVGEVMEDRIYMDALGFGANNCCLQVNVHNLRLPPFL